MPHAVATVDLDAIAANVRTLAATTDAAFMAVVKADAYGHGLVPVARTALGAGATWLGVATFDEALALRSAGIEAPMLAWLWTLDEADQLREAIAAGVDISVGTLAQLEAVAEAAASSTTARVHLKADTGLSRNGIDESQWADAVAAAAKYEAAGTVQIAGVWSHLARADEIEGDADAATAEQDDAFRRALAVAEAAGLSPEVRHLANSAGLLAHPDTHHDLVRIGIAMYGLDPVAGGSGVALRPAMTLRARVVNVKRVPVGRGVSYGHTYRTARDTTLVLVPLGYGDGIPRDGSNVGPVQIAGARFTVSGRVCMDQFVVDVGDHPVAEDDDVILFGAGGPSAADWADATGTIHYEIVTRVSERVPRRYLDVAASAGT